MSGPQLTPAPIEPEKNWFSRHKLASVVMLLVLLIAGFVVALVFGIFALLKSSDVYQQALRKAQNSPAVIEALGAPVKPGWWLTGSINVNGSSGHADIAIPVSGPKGAGTIYAVGFKRGGEWHFNRLEVGVEGRAQRILLIPQNQLSPPELREQ